MSVTELNKQLSEMYKNKIYNIDGIFEVFDNYNNSLTENEAHYRTAWPLLLADGDYNTDWPFLGKTSQNYQSADVKIMIYGQTAYDWGGADAFNRNVCLESVTNEYNDFFTSGKAFEKYGTKNFWAIVKRLIELFTQNNQDKKIGYLWNNIVKVGYKFNNRDVFPEKFYDTIVEPYFNRIIINEEIKILKPDYLVFLTGPDCEWVIEEIFTDERRDINGFTRSQLCEIPIPDVKKAIRTYKTGYLIRLQRNEKERYLHGIVDEITRDIIERA